MKRRIIGLVFVMSAVLSLSAPFAFGGDCNWRCEYGVDTAQCVQGLSTPFSAGTCRETYDCTIVGFVKIQGVWAPAYQCDHECAMTYDCFWA